MGRLDGKVAVNNGAASGIGRGTALCLAREGAAVLPADLNSQGGERVISEISAAGGRAVFQYTDVSSEPDIKARHREATTIHPHHSLTRNQASKMTEWV